MSPLRGVRAAVVFLTRVPVGGAYETRDWAWAAAHFPLVGALLGLLLGALDRALLAPLGAWAAAMLSLGASLLVTGAMHEDGLADTADALGGSHDRERAFAILKDPRIGAFGACAIVVSIGARAALLARLGVDALWAWPLVACAARVAPVWQIAVLPYVSPAGVAKSGMLARAGGAQATVATAWLAVCGGALVLARLVPATRVVTLAGAMVAVGVLTGWRWMRRLGGTTGDLLGATEQMCELAGFAALAWT